MGPFGREPNEEDSASPLFGSEPEAFQRENVASYREPVLQQSRVHVFVDFALLGIGERPRRVPSFRIQWEYVEHHANRYRVVFRD